MAKTILTTSRGNSGSTGIVTSGTNQHYRVGNANLTENITQLRCEVTWRVPGTFSKLYVRVLANTCSASSSVHLRVNSVTVNNSVTIPAGTTGVFEDTTHSDIIADGDEVVYRVVPGAGGAITIALISIVFSPTDTSICVSKQVQHGYSPAAASVTQYVNIAGRLSGTTTVEANTETTVKKAGVVKNAFLYISGNARTTPTTWTLRKNRADTPIVLTAAAGVTGFLEDTTTSVSVAVDDELDWKLTTGAGTEILTFFSLCIDYITTQGDGFINSTCVGASGDITLVPGVTEYYVVGGGMIEATTTEADAAITARDTFTLSNLTVNARANTITAPSTVTLMKNGSPTPMTLTIGSSATGFFSDTTHTVDFTPTDTMSYQVVTGGTGTTLTISQMAIWTVPMLAPEVITGSGGGSQGRSPLYRTRRREPEIAIAIVRVRIPLEYEVEKLSVQVVLPYTFVPEKKLIKYASAILTPLARILPLPIRPTPEPPVQKILRVSVPLIYEVTNLSVKAACSYQVDRLFTQDQQHKIVATSINFLLSDF